MSCKFCTDVAAILQEHNATVEYVELPDNAIATADRILNDELIINVNTNKSEEVQKFIILHVLYHMLDNPDIEMFVYTADRLKLNNEETEELNLKVASTLMPDVKLKYLMLDKDVKDIAILADLFRVTENMVLFYLDIIDIKPS